jgi:hypothetical protein
MRKMAITIRAIPHDEHRYATVGDWQFDEVASVTQGDEPLCILHIKVSQLSDWRREALVAVHELVEALICKHAGVTTEQVDEFDMNFEATRKDGDDSEPGDDPKAPYCRQHQIATVIEKLLSVELSVNWKEYEDELNSLP